MLEGMEDLSPEERAILKDPDFITEDEAEIIIHGRDLEEPAGELFFARRGFGRERDSAPQTKRVTGGWKVVLRSLAKKQYRLRDEGPKRDAAELMHDLEEDPLNIPGAVQRKGYKNAERARFHQKRYRMVYEIFKASKTVIVFRMQPRPTAYDGLKRPGGPP